MRRLGSIQSSFWTRRAIGLLVMLVVCMVGSVVADNRPDQPIRLWAEQAPVAPDREHIRNDRVVEVDNPTLTPFWPETPNGAAVVIFPGGGYHWLAFEKEGVKAARWLNELGVTAFVTKYRLNQIPA